MSIAEKFQMQLSNLEQLNSKTVVGTGAHKDSHAIPPNLLKSVEEVKLAASNFNKTFIGFLKERKAYDNHMALQSLPPDADERYRKHAFQAFVCSRLFAGFENDRYTDSPDFWHSVEPYLRPYEENDFILQKYDLESRHQVYLAEYEELLEKGLSEVMEEFHVNQTGRSAFSRFCCRKLISIVGVHVLSKEFSRADHSKKSLIHQLATNPDYGDKFVKSFVKLAMTAYLLHRLAFQFNPPARTIRCARGAKFDRTYMDKAVPTDDDDSDANFVVGLMLVPGFQVGATVVKCTVFLVPSRSPATVSGPAT
jgi:structural maintenance of chromosome 1